MAKKSNRSTTRQATEAALTGKGKLVAVRITGVSMFTAPASLAEFGIGDKDPRLQVFAGGGRQFMFPEDIVGRVRSITNRIRDTHKEMGTPIPWFAPFALFTDDQLEPWRVREKALEKEQRELLKEILERYDECLKWRKAMSREVGKRAWKAIKAQKIPGKVTVAGHEFTDEESFLVFIADRAMKRMPNPAKLRQDFRVEVKEATPELTLEDLLAAMDSIRDKIKSEVAGMLASMEKNKGALVRTVAERAARLLEIYERSAIMDDDGQMRELLKTLRDKVGPVAGRRNSKEKRDTEGIKQTLEKIIGLADKETTARKRFASLELD